MCNRNSLLNVFRTLSDSGKLTFQYDYCKHIRGDRETHEKIMLIDGVKVSSKTYYEYNTGYANSQEPNSFLMFQEYLERE